MTRGQTGDVLVDARHLTKTYGDGEARVMALENASLTIRPGDRIALTGQSGSGKSTLLHLMAGLEAPSNGNIEWPLLGAVWGLRPGKIAMMMQSPSLIPWLTVAENVALPVQLAGRQDPEAADLALRGLREFGLGDLAAKLPEEISGGQAQRVALLRATVNEPALLLSDEPTGQVDHPTARMLMDALFDWGDRADAAIVVATHDLIIADRFPVRFSMEHGHLEAMPERIAS